MLYKFKLHSSSEGSKEIQCLDLKNQNTDFDSGIEISSTDSNITEKLKLNRFRHLLMNAPYEVLRKAPPSIYLPSKEFPLYSPRDFILFNLQTH